MKSHHRHEYGQSWSLAAALLDGPKPMEEIEEYYRVFARRFSFSWDIFTASEHSGTPPKEMIQRNLHSLIEKGWITYEDSTYTLTEKGKREANNMLDDLRRSRVVLERGTHPAMVSKVTMIVHFFLGAIKLPAALLSGSVGLLNDALDTLMDGLSSVFVFLGVRTGREQLSAKVLLLFMTAAGLYSLYEAIRRILHPEILSPDVLTFVAVAVSGLLCALLWVYQKFSGLKHSCVPLIAQSIDSRNHVLVAGGVVVGLIASYLSLPLLDQLVGILVAVLILKGALELFIDLIRANEGEELDFSKYGFQHMERHRRRQYTRWLLYEIHQGKISSREEMERELKAATDFSRIEPLKALGIEEPMGKERIIQEAIEELFGAGLVKEQPELELTKEGDTLLHKALNDTFRFPLGERRGGIRGVVLRGFLLLLRIGFTAALYTGLFILLRWVHSFLPLIFAWDTFPEVVSIAGFPLTFPQCCIALAGFGLFFWGHWFVHKSRYLLHHAAPSRKSHNLGNLVSHGDGEAEERGSLVTEGLYTHRRHPMYAGFILFQFGLTLALSSLYMLVWAGVIVIIQAVNVVLEDRRLERQFPTEWEEYREDTTTAIFHWYEWIVLFIVYICAWIGFFVPG